jgi:hypothetical protein
MKVEVLMSWSGVTKEGSMTFGMGKLSLGYE